METKRSYRQKVKRIAALFYLLPIVSILMSTQLSGCALTSPGNSSVDRHNEIDTVDRHNAENQSAPEHRFVPYAVPVVPDSRGSNATDPDRVIDCPTGNLQYCDHRKQQCGCVNARDVTTALRFDMPLR